MTDGESYYLIWGSNYIQYDLKFSKGQLREELNPDSKIGCHDVSSSKLLSERVGRKIVNVKSYWSYVKTTNEPKKFYPQDIQLTFENEMCVIISALEITQEGKVNGIADHISVFFDAEVADKCRAIQKL